MLFQCCELSFYNINLALHTQFRTTRSESHPRKSNLGKYQSNHNFFFKFHFLRIIVVLGLTEAAQGASSGHDQESFYITFVVHPFLNQGALCIVTHALVGSHLEYCNLLYMGLPLKNIWELQLVRNMAAQRIIGMARFAHITPLFGKMQ